MNTWIIPLLGLLASASSHAAPAGSCDALRADIEARITAAGVTQFTLVTVDAEARTDGRVVGSCAMGSKKIVYTPHGAGAVNLPLGGARSGGGGGVGGGAILTECRDGTQSVGGDCRR